ncbi:hypothetical protein AGMMS50256_31900 [Betaproteobacteria bacterium]|nr:hypothetical protein AGMMS50256_31900 [Betaproteobacteria bacterium]
MSGAADYETLQSGAMNGAILENYVVSEIVKGGNPEAYLSAQRAAIL